MSTTMFSPPEGLPTGRRVYPGLVVPFAEPVDDAHPDAPRTFTWGDAPRLPRRGVPLDVDHDGKAVGYASGFTLTRDGIWAAIKVGDDGEALLERGYVALSAEVGDDGTIIGVSLVRSGRPAFASAKIHGRRPPEGHLVGLAISEFPNSLSIYPIDQAIPARATRSVQDLGEARRESAVMTMATVNAEIAHRRAEFERRREELQEARMFDEQMRLMAEGRPVDSWPGHLPMRKQWDEMLGGWERERGREVEARRLDQLDVEAAATRLPWPWWRRWLGRWWR